MRQESTDNRWSERHSEGGSRDGGGQGVTNSSSVSMEEGGEAKMYEHFLA